MVTMPMCAVVLPIPLMVPFKFSTTFNVITPDAEMAYRQPILSVTVPSEAFQVLLTNVSDRSKVAVTVLSAFITRSLGLLDGTPAHAPPQALKIEPELAVAVIWMLVPGTKFGLPGGLANTAPLPFPCFWMVNVTSFGWTVMSTVADFPPHVAVMTATPTESAATAPLVASIAATPGLLEVNAQTTPCTVMPCVSTGVAPR